MTTAKAQCSVCKRETSLLICQGCLQNFCRIHLTKHLQILSEQLDHIETDHDQFRQKLNEQKTDVKNHPSIQQVNQWEIDAIQEIKRAAEQRREKLFNDINKFYSYLENELNDLAKKIKDIREENEFNEFDLKDLKQKLTKLEEEEFDKPSNISIEPESTSLVNIPFNKETKWKQDGLTIAGGNDHGNQLNQLYGPRGIFIDDDQTFYIADWNNHRILELQLNARNGRIVAGGNGEGNRMNQLNGPTDVIIDKEKNSLIIADRGNRRVMRWSRQNNTTNGEIIVSNIDCRSLAMDKDGSLYVSDWKKNEVKRWKKGEKNGTIVAGGNGKGDQFNQLNFPSYIFVDKDCSLYVSDRDNHRVMKWLKSAKGGIVVAGGNGEGYSLKQLSEPQGIIVDELGQILVAKWNNHRVMRWCEGKKEGTIIVGGNCQGDATNQLFNPEGLSLDCKGNLYVSDCSNNRLQKFVIHSNDDY